MTDTDKYVCTLDAASLDRAKKELNEDEKNRDGAIETFRAWINQQKWLKTPTDNSFLLRFLRTKKFSQLEARKTLENFWKKRTNNPDWYSNKHANDPKVIELLKTGFLLRLPNTDKDGRIWLMDRPGCLNMDWLVREKAVNTAFKTYSLVLDWLMMDDRSQVNGVCWIVDMGGMSMKHNTNMHTPGNMRKFIDLVQGVYPARVKELHIYNTPPIVEMIITTGSAMLKDKTRKRMKIHGKSLVSMYEKIDLSVLPEEYLPDHYSGPNCGPVSNVIDYMIKELTSEKVSSYIDSLSNGQHCVDMKLKSDDLPAESFRKLNID